MDLSSPLLSTLGDLAVAATGAFVAYLIWDWTGCPPSLSPHDTRPGSITEYKKSEMPANLVGERVDATRETIEKQYDQRSKRERMNKRRRYLENSE